MQRKLRRKRSLLRRTIRRWILLSGITTVCLLFTACGEQESKKTEEKPEAQKDSDSDWTGLISPQDAHNRLEKKSSDEQEESDTHAPLKKVYIEGTSVLCGIYRAEEGEYAPVIGPELRLYPNGEGSFHVHSASSYIASGGYEAVDGMVFAYDEEHTEWYMSEELD